MAHTYCPYYGLQQRAIFQYSLTSNMHKDVCIAPCGQMPITLIQNKQNKLYPQLPKSEIQIAGAIKLLQRAMKQEKHPSF